jgi:hypothetical protein
LLAAGTAATADICSPAFNVVIYDMIYLNRAVINVLKIHCACMQHAQA